MTDRIELNDSGRLLEEIKRLRHELSIVTLNRNSLRQEADELRRKLAVFTDGMPDKELFLDAIRELEYTPNVLVRNWLKRIAAIDDKGCGE